MNLIYRAIFGINNDNLENIVLDNESGLVYSLNEYNIFGNNENFLDSIDNDSVVIIKKWMDKYSETIVEELNYWTGKINSDGKISEIFKLVNYDSIEIISHIERIIELLL